MSFHQRAAELRVARQPEKFEILERDEAATSNTFGSATEERDQASGTRKLFFLVRESLSTALQKSGEVQQTDNDGRRTTSDPFSAIVLQKTQLVAEMAALLVAELAVAAPALLLRRVRMGSWR